MNKAIFILIIVCGIGVFALTGLSVTHSPSSSQGEREGYYTTNSTADIHQLNAQIFVNTSYTDGYAGYLTEQHPAGEIEDHLIITARSPGNSTLTLTANGTYIMQATQFRDILTENFIVHTSDNMTFLITIHSEYLNMTRSLLYRGKVVTPTTFINYQASLFHAKPSGLPLTIQLAAVTFIPGAAIGVYAAFEVAYFTRKWSISHPDLSKNQVGGTGGDIE